MVVKPSTECEAPGLFVRFRYWVAKLIYEVIFVILVRDGSWQEGVFESLAPKAGDRVLDVGPGSSFTALSLALRFPEATFVGLEPSSRAAEKARSKAAQKEIRNLSVIVAPIHGALPFDASSFEKVVCMLGLHDCPPAEKLGIVKEIMRIVRRGGTFHVADFDKPENRGEGGILEFARRISGPAAVASHVNGSWIQFLAKGGFAGVRRQSSHSIGIGRISVVKARKR
ncbi:MULTISPECIES: class I SAM-dependent methyltransferase [unclassified Bradyrhizobium]|uniref:class I SAM-dependent methyltransferase n=1 Tax=unclassified Bradyrhizobium TaxID=2631580 RepID=UPI001BADE149|nr:MULTISPECIES: class I SAM-dependent methyltransferase [unclassified Bradyrhizobium]MBR1208111.1 class I SAM-dependent methyltransferase [Bradyrhizobium sp. AUGA SZCCT0124]MBR1316480.1 class I SAM-dependent methyltransferase [Bradyrhizobium sp. AUGA SZCCT0051]MBR1344625.1 class I SAM-dependent methyltransferase [Bradyrhizobium sp. AUGA SZCCT0105]MBR1359501.1 class I SAM-dependent methyltransferase [Bradyrhizobium sp. AUGA SZCCT0045]